MKKLMITVVGVACALPLFAKIELGTPFADHAVLQRGMKVPVWGKAAAGSKVTVKFAGQEKFAVANAETGAWRVDLDAMTASKESRTMTVVEATPGFFFDSETDVAEVKDVLVGEVWFASGQSNMECPIWGGSTRYRDRNGGLMTTMTKLPCVRFVKNPRAWDVMPQPISATWKFFDNKDLPPSKGQTLSAVAFYFARELYLALDVPVGIVDSSWGGTNIDAWTPRAGYENCDPSIKGTADYELHREWKREYAKGPIGGLNQQPTALWNGMVGSWTPMAMRGFIWYQGCHNSGEPQLYCAKMHALYNGWSKAFENPELKLYFVQLAPFNQNWLGICAAQNKFVAEEKNADLAVTADVGNFDDIHPNDKETVAQRLVVHALKRDYGIDILQDCSPVFKSVEFKDGAAEIDFVNVKNWYVYSPDRSRNAVFEVAGADGAWKPAKIKNYRKDGKANDTDYIDGSKIVVASPEVATPTAVRYMGKARTAGTLYNESSLPLGPFEAR